MSQPSLTRLGQYEIIEVLGRGGMSTVYRARQVSIGREVAVKVLAGELAREADFIERFIKEVQLISRLEHPHILPVIDYGESENTAYLVMRLVNGGSLAERIRRGALSVAEVTRTLREIGSALDYAHRQNVIHRDLKPSNILLDSDGNSYLTDFGVAKLMTDASHLTTTGHVMGTPAYMSPEQGLGLQIDGRADVYALGVILYEMMLGRRPFTADTPPALIFQHVYQPPPRPTLFRADLPQAVEDVMLMALAKRPEERYQTALELASAFLEAVAQAPTPASGVQAMVAHVIEAAPGSPPDSGSTAGVVTQPLNGTPPTVISQPTPSARAALRKAGSRRFAIIGVVVAAVALAVVGLSSVAAPGAVSATATASVTSAATFAATAQTPSPSPSPTAGRPPSDTPPPVESPIASPGAVTALDVAPITATELRVAPADDAGALARVNPAQRLVATARDATGAWIWVRVVATGREGWVSAADLGDADAPLAALPVRAP